MRTDLATTKSAENPEAETKKKLNDQKIVLGSRRSLQPLQKAAGDKENLVGAGRSLLMTSTKESNPPPESKPSKRLAKARNAPQTITEEDLTSEAGPSQKYWEILAEKRRLALENALEENKRLHARVEILEEENSQYQVLLDEARVVIETLNEIVNEESIAQTDADATDPSFSASSIDPELPHSSCDEA